MAEILGLFAIIGIPFILITAIYLTIQDRRLRELERRRDEDNTS